MASLTFPRTRCRAKEPVWFTLPNVQLSEHRFVERGAWRRVGDAEYDAVALGRVDPGSYGVRIRTKAVKERGCLRPRVHSPRGVGGGQRETHARACELMEEGIVASI